MVDADISGDGVKPCREFGFGLKLVGALNDTQEYVLREVPRPVWIPRRPQNEGKNGVPVPLQEPLESLRVSLLEGREKLLVAGFLAHRAMPAAVSGSFAWRIRRFGLWEVLSGIQESEVERA